MVLAGRTWLGGRLQPVEIAIDDGGRIQSVGRVREGRQRHDVGDSVILPAATDLHVHMREPGGSGETVASATVEAALGGVTLVGEMPNTDPPVNSLDRLEEKEALVRGRAAVDVLLYASPTASRSVPSLARRAGAFKIYLSPTTGIDAVPEAAELPALLERLASFDLPVSVHAEDPSAFSDRGAPADPAAWNSRRPPRAEAQALAALRPAPDRLRLHVAHVTTPASVVELRGRGRSFEASAHHLLLSDRSGTDTRFKVNPPLRREADRAGLWTAFCRGEVPCLASDHAPHPVDRKSLRFDRAPSGMPGLETTLPLMLAEVRSGELSLDVLMRAACDRPARWFGQPVGRIAPGHRANLLVVDFRARQTLQASQLHAPCGWTAFEGWEAILPREHWRDGERIVRDGEYVGRPSGRVVVPEFSPAARPRP
jgi:dihydroorotase